MLLGRFALEKSKLCTTSPTCLMAPVLSLPKMVARDSAACAIVAFVERLRIDGSVFAGALVMSKEGWCCRVESSPRTSTQAVGAGGASRESRDKSQLVTQMYAVCDRPTSEAPGERAPRFQLATEIMRAAMSSPWCMARVESRPYSWQATRRGYKDITEAQQYNAHVPHWLLEELEASLLDTDFSRSFRSGTARTPRSTQHRHDAQKQSNLRVSRTASQPQLALAHPGWIVSRLAEDYVNTSVAPAFGSLTSESLQHLDEELKILALEATRAIHAVPVALRSWDRIVEALTANQAIRRVSNDIHRSDTYKNVDSGLFRGDGVNEGVKRQVYSWFVNLIGDDDVLQVTRIDIDAFGHIVAVHGQEINDPAEIFYRSKSQDRTIMDIGLLRYPDPDHPHMKLYRIQLHAWARSEGVLCWSEDTNGIDCSKCHLLLASPLLTSLAFDLMLLGPDEEHLRAMTESARKESIKEADGLFS
nr:hypothetical protein CFP56_32335 [Quercus suber]